MLRLFCALTGGDYKLVQVETPASRKKVATLGSVMLIPAIMWFLIASCTAFSMFEASVTIAMLPGFVAATIILILERAIVMSGHNKMVIRFRLVIGFVIASLGAVFMDELIFEKDIEQRQYNERSAMIDVKRAKTDSIYKPKVEALEATVSKTRHSWMATAEDARKEADGTGGSGHKGVSKITQLKLEQADVLKDELDKIESETQKINAEWNQKIAAIQPEIETNLHGKSILTRIMSLFGLVFSNWIAGIIYIVFTVFLFSLEFIVIIMKHSLPETNYERRVAAMEQVGKRRMERLVESCVLAYDPGDNTEQVRKINMELRKPLPTLFKRESNSEFETTHSIGK